MNKTISISIARLPFVCDEEAYEQLSKYLSNAKSTLHDDPDMDEIMSDLESALAGHLSAKSEGLVVDITTAKDVLELMGEVRTEPDSDDGETHNRHPDTSINEPFIEKLKKLIKGPVYKDKSRAVIEGICAGIAKKIDVDPLIIRIIFIALIFLTQGWMILAYFVGGFIIPSEPGEQSKTAEDVVKDIKNKVVSVDRKPYEKMLRGVFLGLYLVVKWAVIGTTLFTLMIVGCVWCVLFFQLIFSPQNYKILGGNPSPDIITLMLAIGVVLILPLIALLLGLSKNIAKKSSAILVLLCIWMLAIMVAVGIGISILPSVRERVINDPPHNEFIKIDVKNGEINDICIDITGGCMSNETMHDCQYLNGSFDHKAPSYNRHTDTYDLHLTNVCNLTEPIIPIEPMAPVTQN